MRGMGIEGDLYRPGAPFCLRSPAFAEGDSIIYRKNNRIGWRLSVLPCYLTLADSGRFPLLPKLEDGGLREPPCGGFSSPSNCHPLRRQRTSGRKERGGDIGRPFASSDGKGALYRPGASFCPRSSAFAEDDSFDIWDKRLGWRRAHS